MSGCRPGIGAFVDRLKARNPHEPEIHRVEEEFPVSVMPRHPDHRDCREAGTLERPTEPDRTIRFRVGGQDDDGALHCGRVRQVQIDNAPGPYKGGLRFRGSVTEGVLLKFLAVGRILMKAYGPSSKPSAGAAR